MYISHPFLDYCHQDEKKNGCLSKHLFKKWLLGVYEMTYWTNLGFFPFDKLVEFLSNAGITFKKKNIPEVILSKASIELWNKWLIYC